MYIYAKLYVIYDNFLSTLSPTRPPFTSQLPFVCSSLQPCRNKDRAGEAWEESIMFFLLLPNNHRHCHHLPPLLSVLQSRQRLIYKAPATSNSRQDKETSMPIMDPKSTMLVVVGDWQLLGHGSLLFSFLRHPPK